MIMLLQTASKHPKMGLVYTVKIKENLKWSDGEPLTAEDVVYSYNAENEAMQTFYVNGAPNYI